MKMKFTKCQLFLFIWLICTKYTNALNIKKLTLQISDRKGRESIPYLKKEKIM